jgi:hypothetical protein
MQPSICKARLKFRAIVFDAIRLRKWPIKKKGPPLWTMAAPTVPSARGVWDGDAEQHCLRSTRPLQMRSYVRYRTSLLIRTFHQQRELPPATSDF